MLNSSGIKYITVSNNFDILYKVLFQSRGVNHNNIIIVDNTLINNPISYNYNRIIDNLLIDSKSEWLVFCHQDFYMEDDILPRLDKLDKNYIYGPIGATIASPVLLGRIIQTNGKPIGTICDGCFVDTLDAMCIIINKDIIRKYNLTFDENFKYHFYVEDFCLQAKTKGIFTRIIHMNCHHRSRTLTGDINSSEYKESRKILIDKWKHVRTTTGIHKLNFNQYEIQNLIEILENKI